MGKGVTKRREKRLIERRNTEKRVRDIHWFVGSPVYGERPVTALAPGATKIITIMSIKPLYFIVLYCGKLDQI